MCIRDSLLLYLICDFHLEGSESAFMTGYFLPVQIYFATVTYRTEIEKQTFVVSLWGIERASVPCLLYTSVAVNAFQQLLGGRTFVDVFLGIYG